MSTVFDASIPTDDLTDDSVFELIRGGFATTYKELIDYFQVGDDYKALDASITALRSDKLIEFDYGLDRYIVTKQGRDIQTHSSLSPLYGSKLSIGNAITISPLFQVPNNESHALAYFDVLVVMPFQEDLSTFYEEGIKTTVEELHLSVGRADELFSSRSIMDDIWRAIYFSKFLIADCSYKNPNVFYEVGIAHTLGKPVVLLSQSNDDIPFDLRHLRHIFYNPEDFQESGFLEKLRKAIHGLDALT